MDFEWDPAKARENETKHGVSFAEASEVFADRGDRIRIISARSMTRRERTVYEH
jgi:uncharacterized DUF497 family protein